MENYNQNKDIENINEASINEAKNDSSNNYKQENKNHHENKIIHAIKNHFPNSYDVSQSYGGMENLLMSFGQKPFNSQDYEAQGIIQAFKQDNTHYEENEDHQINN
ncbi:hypothetical protein DICPUDRAFT_156252 [Dictyostelium purpureum]|uniref:Uncharacterized protein n=1 Tax=Dictyostelium purpureum TaxID=5786 RepID=F0ZW39_DICPU|nr:uncharacterized protein DICPUDRAFT_156252 [Dictyostelium purpureum]EGC31832.1 hypothetical protein DICPUDRAFT_156252 [Dictyostelium purpureum]|eukprot:XP_003291633.1 hypothetical protein DICPUDRAFT_156252 [Dictyostelium purpureum]